MKCVLTVVQYLKWFDNQHHEVNIGTSVKKIVGKILHIYIFVHRYSMNRHFQIKTYLNQRDQSYKIYKISAKNRHTINRQRIPACLRIIAESGRSACNV